MPRAYTWGQCRNPNCQVERARPFGVRLDSSGNCDSCYRRELKEKRAAVKAEAVPAPEPEQLESELLSLEKLQAIVQAASNAGWTPVVVPLSESKLLEKIFDPTSGVGVCRISWVEGGPFHRKALEDMASWPKQEEYTDGKP